jgi:hypothetical protein
LEELKLTHPPVHVDELDEDETEHEKKDAGKDAAGKDEAKEKEDEKKEDEKKEEEEHNDLGNLGYNAFGGGYPRKDFYFLFLFFCYHTLFEITKDILRMVVSAREMISEEARAVIAVGARTTGLMTFWDRHQQTRHPLLRF